MSNHQNTSNSAKEIDIEEQIINLEASLEKIKQRYQQIQVDKLRKEELNERQRQIKAQLSQEKRHNSLKSELKYINDELEEIKFRLESELFQWSSLSEPFWQVVRFFGMGIVIGWILKTYSG
jgi:hypothetical protein